MSHYPPGADSLTDLNVLVDWLAVRDPLEHVDVAVLLGGAPVGAADLFAQMMRERVAETYVVVGGRGHTTPAFEERLAEMCPEVTAFLGASEAEAFAAYLRVRHGLEPDLLETRSTNCGENVAFLRELLAEHDITPGTMLLVHDASMERRIVEVARAEMPHVRPVAYASHRARFSEDGLVDAPVGMWSPEHYAALLMGEVPRLRDDEHGYGPFGAGFIGHVDVPREVEGAWRRLAITHPEWVRQAIK